MDPDQLRYLVDASRATKPRHRFVVLVICFVAGALFTIGVAAPQDDAAVAITVKILPGALLIGLAIGMAVIGSRKSKWLSTLRKALEAHQLQQWGEAKSKLGQALSNPVHPEVLRVQAILALADIAVHEHNYSAASVAYHSVLEEQQAEPFYQNLAAIGLAGVLLRTERLTEAIRILDRLGRHPMPNYLQSLYEATQLHREIVTGRLDDAIGQLDHRRKLARDHLSTGAGYVYALMAWACHVRGDRDRARSFWSDATLLIDSQRLLYALPDAPRLDEIYPAHEMPT